uniref:Uncharacterized protein n=1 Tax=Thuricola similis TaxID=2784598 RepID=A0A7T8G5A0_9CILI|nr:hypothetical protein K4Z05_mgp02 [Thuricola similis]QQP22161.1 hypothetical protein TSIM_55 [Thuricola similis]
MQDILPTLIVSLNSLNPIKSLLLVFQSQTHINLDFVDSYANILNSTEGLEALEKLYIEAQNSLKSTQTRVSNIRKEITSLRENAEFFADEDQNNFFVRKDREEDEMSIELLSIQEEYFSNIWLEKQKFCDAIDFLDQKIRILRKKQ